MSGAAEVVLDGSLLLALPIAFAAGLVSFLSPCVLPLAPGYLAYVTGLTGADLRARNTGRPPERVAVGVSQRVAVPRTPYHDRGIDLASVPAGSADGDGVGPPAAVWRGRVVLGALLFVLGFSAVFVSYGLVFGGLGGALLEYQRAITIVLGLAVIVLGLGFLGFPLLARTFWWNADRRTRLRPPTGLWGAPLLGVVFGLGWTPCIGPTLAAVQTLAFTQGSALRGAILSLAYCLGLGLPFLLIALGLRSAAGALTWTRQRSALITAVGGVMLVLVGTLLVTGLWNDIVIWLQTRWPDFAVVL